MLFLAGCSPQPVSQATPTLLPPTAIPTRTFAVSRTPTAENTITPAPTATITPTPQPTSEMATAHLIGTGALPNWQYFFTVRAAESIQGNYTALVDGNIPYECEVVAQDESLLYCWGRVGRLERWIPFTIYEQDSDKAVYSGEFFIPLDHLDLNQ
jgi:hypothetical protein